jgi:HupE / UreJ protein/Domain of unknown function (DUF6702)
MHSGRRAALTARAAALGLFLMSASVSAHPLSASYSRFLIEKGTVRAIVRLPLDDMDLLLRLDRDLNDTVSPAEIERARPALERYLTERIAIEASEGRLGGSLRELTMWKDRDGSPYLEATLVYPSSQQVGGLTMQVQVLTDLYKDHRNLAEIESGTARHQFVFQHGNKYRTGPAEVPFLETVTSFIVLGVEHIFTGYDHILFLLGLLLVGRGFRNLVIIVTSFTVAHSLTLSLAILGAIEPAAWTVEAAIALTIAYVGLENLIASDVRHRWKITFLFGLIHGFGFANVLRTMELSQRALAVSLFSFNLGVEMGQVAIVGLMLPFLMFLERTQYRKLVTQVASSVIVALGLFWFYQRVR